MKTQQSEVKPESTGLEPDEIVWIGRNEYDYTFGVCRFGMNWHGFAHGKLPSPDSAMIFFLPFDSLSDKETAVKKTVAFVFSIESCYGGISEWVPEYDSRLDIQKARDTDFQCPDCGEPFCDGDCIYG